MTLEPGLAAAFRSTVAEADTAAAVRADRRIEHAGDHEQLQNRATLVTHSVPT